MVADKLISAIPTLYKGIQLKSRMEAQCAFLFDQLGWKWEYEPESLMLSNGVTYIPDFSLDEGHLIVECRGYENERGTAQIEGFIHDLPDLARKRDGYLSFLVMGPDECAVCENRSQKVQKREARLTWCPRCDEWGLHDFAHDWKTLCPSCIELTFNDCPLTVKDGKFAIHGMSFEEAAANSCFDRERRLFLWSSSFFNHVCESLGRCNLRANKTPEGDLLFWILARLLRAGRKNGPEEGDES